MIHDILAFIINLLIVDPLQSEISQRLSDARAPQALIADVRTCAEASMPRLADRAMNDPAWVVTTGLDVWLGRSTPESLLGSMSPQCSTTINSAKAYFTGRGA
jgi:hypothetical protein